MADKKISALTGATTPLAGSEVLPIVQSGATVKVAVSDLTAGRAVSATQLTSTIAIGTAPLVVTSTTNVANLNASSLNGATFAAPGAIGGGTASAITATTVNKVTITAPASASTLTIANGKTLTASNTLTLAGTDATTQTFPTTSATIARTDAAQTFTGDQTLATGNLVIGTSGKGIDFSATPGTGTSELLADYEEGTWTPTDISGAGLTFTNTSNNCFYTKIGNLVTCGFNVTYPATASVAIVAIGGLPFTSQATTSGIYGGAFSFTNVGVSLTSQVDAYTQIIYMYVVSTSATATNVQLSEKIIRGFVTYRV